MFLQHQFFQGGQFGFGRLQDQQHFRALLDFALPAVMRLDFGNEIRAGDEPGCQRGFGQRAGGFQVRCRDENEGEFRGGFHFAEIIKVLSVRHICSSKSDGDTSSVGNCVN